MGTHPIFESDFDCLTGGFGLIKKKKNKNPTDKKEGGGKVEKKYVNEFTARRNEKRPNQYSKEAQTKREKLAKMKQEEYAEKREQKIQEKATKKLARKDRDKIMNMKTKKGQPVLQARIGLYLKDLESNPDLYKAHSKA